MSNSYVEYSKRNKKYDEILLDFMHGTEPPPPPLQILNLTPTQLLLEVRHIDLERDREKQQVSIMQPGSLIMSGSDARRAAMAIREMGKKRK